MVFLHSKCKNKFLHPIQHSKVTFSPIIWSGECTVTKPSSKDKCYVMPVTVRWLDVLFVRCKIQRKRKMLLKLVMPTALIFVISYCLTVCFCFTKTG